MSYSLNSFFKHQGLRLSWLRRSSLLLVVLLLLAAPRVRAGLLDGLLHQQGDSGSGKVAQLAFHLDDGFGATTVVWSPDARFIATTGILTRTIHIWDVAQRKLVKELELPNQPAAHSHNMAWSPDGRYLAVCNSFATSLRIYATKDWSIAKDFGREDALACQKAAFSSDSQELTMWGGDLATFAVSDWHVIKRFKGVWVKDGKFGGLPHPWDQYLLLHDMAYVPGTHTLVLGGAKFTKGSGVCEPSAPYDPFAGLVWIVKPGDTELHRPFVVYCRPHGTDVWGLAVDPDGKTLATVTGGSEVAPTVVGPPIYGPQNNTRILRLVDGKNITPALAWHSDNLPGGLAYTPDGRFLIIGERGWVHTDHAVYIVDAKTMQLLDTVHAPPSIYDLTAAPDSTGFAVATGGGVTVWTFAQG